MKQGSFSRTIRATPNALARVRRRHAHAQGDSAACGFRELSELAHGLEDLLTPALVIERGEAVAELVLSAAGHLPRDARILPRELQPPDISELRTHIRKLAERPGSESEPQPVHSRAEWTPKEKARILEASARRRVGVVSDVLRMDRPSRCRRRLCNWFVAALEQCGTILAQSPASGAPLQTLAAVHVALAKFADF